MHTAKRIQRQESFWITSPVPGVEPRAAVSETPRAPHGRSASALPRLKNYQVAVLKTGLSTKVHAAIEDALVHQAKRLSTAWSQPAQWIERDCYTRVEQVFKTHKASMVGFDTQLPSAQYALGRYLLWDACQHPDTGRSQSRRGIKLLQCSSSAGYMPAYYELGVCFEQRSMGIPVMSDSDLDREARIYFLLSYKGGYVPSAYAYGRCCLNGFGGKTRYRRAFGIYQTLVRKHYYNARVRLGYCYFFGLGCKQDRLRAFKIFLGALEHGDRRAYF